MTTVTARINGAAWSYAMSKFTEPLSTNEARAAQREAEALTPYFDKAIAAARAEGKAEGFAEGVEASATRADELEGTGMRGTEVVDIGDEIRALVPRPSEATASEPELDLSPEFLANFLDNDDSDTPSRDPDKEHAPSATEAPVLDLDELERILSKMTPGAFDIVRRQFSSDVMLQAEDGTDIAHVLAADNARGLAALHNAAPELIRRARERDSFAFFNRGIQEDRARLRDALKNAERERDEAQAELAALKGKGR